MKNKIFRSFLFDIIILSGIFLTFFLNGCSCKPCQEKEESQIPINVIKRADQFIISKTGNEFFKKYITADFSQSKHISPNYLMVYKLYMPEKSFVDETVRFTTDSSGNVLKQFEIIGIPNCNSNLNDCDFIVDEKIAKQIATQNGLAKGIKDWKVDFVWDNKYDKYVWEIISTIKEIKNEENNRAEGEKIIIDANNSSILSKDNWKIN